MTHSWFETHAHLCDAKFDPDRDVVLERARAAGVDRIVEIADGPDEWDKAQSLAERNPGFVWWAAGLHPYYADQGSDDVFRRLEELSRHPQFVAVGEIGLDYAKCAIPPDVQKESFSRAVRLAKEINKPLIVHCRDAYQDLIPLLQADLKPHLQAQPGVVHCFSGTAEHAQDLVSMGFFLGVDAPITYPKSQALREALKSVSPGNLVLETDSPYLPPQTHRGQRNEPSQIPAIGETLAQLLTVSVASLATISRQNGDTLFRLNNSTSQLKPNSQI